MIWNNAADVLFNGSSVNAVICNSEVIWPPDQEADSWTCLYISALSADTCGSELGLSIFDGRNRKIYTTDGLKPISSYNRITSDTILISASGVSPYRFTFSGSGEPYHILNVPRTTSRISGHWVYRSPLSTSVPGSFISGSGYLLDSLNPGFYSASNPMWTFDYKKILQVSGLARSHSSNQAYAMIFFVPTDPYSGILSAYNSGTPWSSQVFLPHYTSTSAGTGGLDNFSSYLYNTSSVYAFDMFNSVNHSGDVGIRIGSNTVLNQVTVSSNNVAYASWFPSTILSSTNQTHYYLSGGKNLDPTSVGKGTQSSYNLQYGVSAQFSSDAGTHAYLGLYSMTTTHSAVTSESIKCWLSSIPYTASAQVP